LTLMTEHKSLIILIDPNSQVKTIISDMLVNSIYNIFNTNVSKKTVY
jgi:hypothetical protein